MNVYSTQYKVTQCYLFIFHCSPTAIFAAHSFHQKDFHAFNYLQSGFEQQNVSLNLSRPSLWRNVWVDSVSVLSRFFLPPAVVSVGSVGFGHLVQLILLLDNVALHRGGCQQFLGKFFIHVHASVFVVPALRDHPFHGEEATSVVRERDGHLGGVQTECN